MNKLYVFTVATRKRKAPAKSDRLIDGLVAQFTTSQKESTSIYIAAEEKHYKVLSDMEEKKAQRDMAFRVEERAEERKHRAEEKAEERKHEERMMQMMLMMNQTQSQQFPNAHTNMHSPTHTGLTHLTMLHPPSTSHSQSHSSPNGSFFSEY